MSDESSLFRVLDNIVHLFLYTERLRDSAAYPSEYIELVDCFRNKFRFRFEKPSFFKKGVGGYFDTTTREIVLLRINNDTGIVKPSILLHELTHALRREPFPGPKQCDYSSYMKSMLQEECVAVSSENYGCTEFLDNGKFPKIFMLDQKQQKNLNSFSRDIRDLGNPFSRFLYEDKKILIAAIIHSMVAQSVYQTSNGWWTRYTKYYNDANNTNHAPPRDGFEVPLLPPTLARQVSGVFDRIFERIPEDQHHAHPVWQHWMRMTGIDLDTLQLAAAQKKWPTYPSEVFTEMSHVSNGR